MDLDNFLANSHTHCQAAQPNATTQAWQRVCLSNRTVKPTGKHADEEEQRTANIGIASSGLMCELGALCF